MRYAIDPHAANKRRRIARIAHDNEKLELQWARFNRGLLGEHERGAASHPRAHAAERGSFAV